MEASRSVPPVRFMDALVHAECPDCDADIVLREDPVDDRKWHLDIGHDHTCPAYRGLTE